MREILADLMDAAAGRSDYADVRHVRSRAESVSTRNGGVDAGAQSGGGGHRRARAVGGAWGFAATRGTSVPPRRRALARALAIAEAQPRRGRRVPLAPEPPARGAHSSRPRGPVRRAARGQARRARGGGRRHARATPASRSPRAFRRVPPGQAVRLHRGRAVRAADRRVRRRRLRHRGERQRDAGPLVPGLAPRARGQAGYEHFDQPRPGGERAARGRGGDRAAHRRRLPGRARPR